MAGYRHRYLRQSTNHDDRPRAGRSQGPRRRCGVPDFQRPVLRAGVCDAVEELGSVAVATNHIKRL